jgi:hypothetical protein
VRPTMPPRVVSSGAGGLTTRSSLLLVPTAAWTRHVGHLVLHHHQGRLHRRQRPGRIERLRQARQSVDRVRRRLAAFAATLLVMLTGCGSGSSWDGPHLVTPGTPHDVAVGMGKVRPGVETSFGSMIMCLDRPGSITLTGAKPVDPRAGSASTSSECALLRSGGGLGPPSVSRTAT